MIQTVELPMPLPSCANLREHWRVRAKRTSAQRLAVTWALQGKCAVPALPCTVTLVRVASRALDDDNLGSCFKAIRDAVAEWIGVSDGPRSGITWRYDQTKCIIPKYQAARIIIDGEVPAKVEPVSLSQQRRFAIVAAEECKRAK